MAPSDKFQIEQIAPHPSLSWALTESLLWNQQVNDVLKQDADGTLFTAAYDAVDWEKYYERLRGTPFYDWAVEGGGILTFGGPYHVEHDCLFSRITDTSTVEGYWLREHPEFNHVLHDIHVETAGQMIDFILAHAPKKKRRKRRRKRPWARPGNAPKAGDSVLVRPGTMDPDFDIDIDGWQGRVLEGPGDDDMVLVRWDSITLRAVPDSVIEQSMERGLDWTEMILKVHEVELAGPRDTEEDVARAITELSKKHAWSFLGEEGRRIAKILAGIDPDDEMALLDAWEDHLVKHLVFPFEAQVSEYQDRRGPLQAGDCVTVMGISAVDHLHGIIVRMTHRRQLVAFPLCDLEVTDEHSSNYQLVEDYIVWFANR